ncbi:hypothetical protein [Gordonia sihwensis]|uniref:hypothetical protein n=1 Tax=Gordonia sihwensis TaxID=173559 RepID=UPI003D972BCF
MPFEKISEIRSANAAIGHHWFETAGCRAETPILGGRYWVESRPAVDDPRDVPDGRRWYAAVQAADDGSVRWVDHNQNRLDSLEEARAMIDALL